MLNVRDLHVHYGKIAALRGVDMAVAEGEFVAVIGSNGAGKTTLMNTISGFLKPRQGTVEFRGRSLAGLAPHDIAAMGIVQVPEGRGVFAAMTVLENLEMGAYLHRGRGANKEQLKQMYEKFPVLEERRHQAAGTLSGGEQQMLAIARALMTRPKVLLLDEPSQGLAPLIVKAQGQLINGLHKQEGLTVILVEQNARMALAMAERGCVLQTGELVMEGQARQLLANEALRAAYLGV